MLLAAPGTREDRLVEIGAGRAVSSYCVATYGVTGARERVDGIAAEVVDALRPHTDLPLLVGVGIGAPAQAAEVCAFADGVVVGSALMSRVVGGDLEGTLRLAAEFRRRPVVLSARILDRATPRIPTWTAGPTGPREADVVPRGLHLRGCQMRGRDSMKDRHWMRALALVAVLTMVGAACSEDTPPGGDNGSTEDPLGTITIAEGEPITVAVIESITGATASLGNDQVRGIEIAVEDRGAELLGHPIELQTEDDGCDAAVGTTAAQKVVADESIVGVIGTSCSGAAVPAMETSLRPDSR